jgi:hypothetical protein
MVASTIDLILNSYSSLYLALATFIGSYGGAAMILAITVSGIMIYPLRWAHKVAVKEQLIVAALSPSLERIKKQSTGAEQHGRISSLYNRYGYHPIYAVRSLTGLLIQVPALILTYFMFDGIADLNGVGFFLIKDLGEPDGLLFTAGNALPFVMTAFNVLAAFLTPRLTKAGLVQALVTSLLFFFLLYEAKSALLIFWTTNNAIFLARNIYKYRENKATLPLDLKRSWLKLRMFLLTPEVAYFFAVFFLYSIVPLQFIPHGPNSNILKAFTGLALLALSGIASLHLIFFIGGGGGMRQQTFNLGEKTYAAARSMLPTDALLALIPMAVALQIITKNQDLISLEIQMLFLGITFLLLCVTVLIIPAIIERTFSRAVFLIPLSSAFMFTLMSTSQLVTIFRWPRLPDIWLVFMIFAVLLIVLLFTYVRYRRLLHIGISLFFSMNLFVLAQSQENVEADVPWDIGAKNALNIDVNTPIKKTPDIFLLTYDAYVASEVMEQYGIDNTAQERFLQKQGFEIYPGTYSLGFGSLASMGLMLDIGLEAGGSTSGDALLPRLLGEHGYETNGILNPYFFSQRGTSSYDKTYPQIQSNAVGLTPIWTGFIRGRFQFGDILNNEGERIDWVNAKRRVLGTKEGPPRFLYAHSTLPGHSQNSGKCLDNEVGLFETRLQSANQEMRDDLETILDNTRDSIIIVNGDHGPYLTAGCAFMENYSLPELRRLHLQDRLGAFLAIRWPSDFQEDRRSVSTIQDAFIPVLSYLFQIDQPRNKIPSRITMPLGQKHAAGMVVDGIIMVGEDAGEPLYQN